LGKQQNSGNDQPRMCAPHSNRVTPIRALMTPSKINARMKVFG
jgi:hypothetical protein